jgi:hypothetical protein
LASFLSSKKEKKGEKKIYILKKKEKEKRYNIIIKKKRGIRKRNDKENKEDEAWDSSTCVCYPGALYRSSKCGRYNVWNWTYVVQIATAEASVRMRNGVFRL